MKSAFGIVHKSFARDNDGNLKPYSVTRAGGALHDGTRKEIRASQLRRAYNSGKTDAQAAPSATQHRKADVLDDYGYVARRRSPEAMERRLKHEFDHNSHVPSARHKNLYYGRSTTPQQRQALDHVINPKHIKGPVVIHHDPHLEGIGAAVNAHRATGHRAHVVLGANFKANGKLGILTHKWSGGKAHFGLREVVNHELVHTQGKKLSLGQRDFSAAPREEARADHFSGANAYNHQIPRGRHYADKDKSEALKWGLMGPEHHAEGREYRAMRTKLGRLKAVGKIR